MTPAPVDFYFDFSSPYAYFAALRIDAIAAKHGRTATWHPFMLGAAFKQTGMAPLVQQPLRGDYSLRDWDRLARRWGVPFVLPAAFPMVSLAAARAFYWLADSDESRAKALALRVFHAFFGEGRDMTAVDAVADEAAALGVERAAVVAAVAAPRWKDQLKAQTEAALARGVFGSPFTIVDGEPFWGNDRLDDVDQWLATGGW